MLRQYCTPLARPMHHPADYQDRRAPALRYRANQLAPLPQLRKAWQGDLSGVPVALRKTGV